MEKTRKSGSVVELNYRTTIVGSDDKVIRKNVKARFTCDIDDIRSVDYFFNSTGQLEPDKCKIYHDPTGWMVLDEPYEKVHNLKMTGNISIAGFQQRKERRKTIKNFEKYGCNYQFSA